MNIHLQVESYKLGKFDFVFVWHWKTPWFYWDCTMRWSFASHEFLFSIWVAGSCRCIDAEVSWTSCIVRSFFTLNTANFINKYLWKNTLMSWASSTANSATSSMEDAWLYSCLLCEFLNHTLSFVQVICTCRYTSILAGIWVAKHNLLDSPPHPDLWDISLLNQIMRSSSKQSHI